tara:strand:+ start:2279 stop:3067 length:789 start_codon:yes stop_codon:yes gene_type:complete
MKIRILFLILFVSLYTTLSAGWKEKPEFGAVFEEAGVTGTFVLLDPDSGDLHGYHAVRAATRFVPASTFKIPHTVIALSEGVVAGIDEIIPYGGQPLAFKDWERDMPLKEALALSNASVFQQVAARIGLERMDKNIRNLCYGNMNLGENVTRFWLDGPLKITAIEQIQVIRNLMTKDMGYPAVAIAAMKEGIKIEEGAGWILYAKSGWQNAPGPGVGWWVGWIDQGDQEYFFAMNIDIVSVEDAKQREVVSRKCLALGGLLE